MEERTLERVHAGPGPVRSPAVGGWLVAIDEGRKLRIASNPDGADLWPTGEESERAAKERALAEVAELEAEVARLRGGSR